MSDRIAIVDGIRTPFCKAGTDFKGISAQKLAAVVIRELLDATHTASDTPVVTYCNTGRDATIGYVAYRIAGFREVAVYDGSMAEWGNDTTCPMTTPKE